MCNAYRKLHFDVHTDGVHVKLTVNNKILAQKTQK